MFRFLTIRPAPRNNRTSIAPVSMNRIQYNSRQMVQPKRFYGSAPAAGEKHDAHAVDHGHGHGHRVVPLHERLLGKIASAADLTWPNSEGGFSGPVIYTEEDLQKHDAIAKEVGIETRFLNDPVLHVQFVKLQELFQKLGIENDAKAQEDVINNTLISPGWPTLEFVFSYPPPEHTWAELAIAKLHQGQLEDMELPENQPESVEQQQKQPPQPAASH